MPTGYTSNIKDGISFNDFIIQCARAFGACVTMRDELSNKEIPLKFEQSDYYVKKIKEYETKFQSTIKIKVSRAEKEAKKEYKEEIKKIEKCIKDSEVLFRKYNGMLLQVKFWKPPTLEHSELKSFMIDQLEKSIKFDCNGDYWKKQLDEIKLLSGEEWINSKKAKIIKDLQYYIEENRKEKERIDGRNNWIKQLRDSLR